MNTSSRTATTNYYNSIFPEDSKLIFQKVYVCPACWRQGQDTLLPLPPTRLYRCRACGIVYISPRLTDDILDKLYLENPGEMTEETGLALESYMAERYRTMKREMFPVIQSDKKSLMDIGCGWGHFLKQAEPDYSAVEGIELSSRQSSWAHSALGLNVSQLNIFEAEIGKRYGVITLWEVIEHLTRPQTFINWAFEHLEPGGQFILSTPNFNSLFRIILGPHWFYHIPTQHLNYFTPQSIKGLLHRAGFGKIKVVTSGRSLLRERRNRHNQVDTSADLRTQWLQSLQLRDYTEKNREINRPSQGVFMKILNPAVWRCLQIIYRAGMGDQMRVYALKP